MNSYVVIIANSVSGVEANADSCNHWTCERIERTKIKIMRTITAFRKEHEIIRLSDNDSNWIEKMKSLLTEAGFVITGDYGSLNFENTGNDSAVTSESCDYTNVSLCTDHGSESKTPVERPLPSIAEAEKVICVGCNKTSGKSKNNGYCTCDFI